MCGGGGEGGLFMYSMIQGLFFGIRITLYFGVILRTAF